MISDTDRFELLALTDSLRSIDARLCELLERIPAPTPEQLTSEVEPPETVEWFGSLESGLRAELRPLVDRLSALSAGNL